MNGVPPVVRYMIICDDVLINSQFSKKPVIVGLTTSVRATAGYPFRLSKLCVYLVLTGGRGQGEAKLRIVDDDSDSLIVEYSHTLAFAGNPLALSGLVWRLQELEFPNQGVYRIEFCYYGQCLAQQLVEAR